MVCRGGFFILWSSSPFRLLGSGGRSCTASSVRGLCMFYCVCVYNHTQINIAAAPAGCKLVQLNGRGAALTFREILYQLGSCSPVRSSAAALKLGGLIQILLWLFCPRCYSGRGQEYANKPLLYLYSCVLKAVALLAALPRLSLRGLPRCVVGCEL